MWAFRFACVICGCLLPALGQAQVAVPANQWTHGTELAVLVGSATSDSHTGAFVAGSVGWEMNRWTTVEARASWFDRDAHMSAFAADLNARMNVVSRREVTPYVGVGFGLYHASFENAMAPMSAFYRRRMIVDPPAGAMTFNDPLLRVSGGVDVVVARHWLVRPEAGVIVVRSEATGSRCSPAA